MKELFNGDIITTPDDDHNLAFGKPSVLGSKVLSWLAFKNWLLTYLFGSTTRRVTKVINIGDWNMDTTATVDVAHGLTTAQIATISKISVIIRSDAGVISGGVVITPLDSFSSIYSNTIQGGINYTNNTNVTLERLENGMYDGNSYDSTSYNRGFIEITYIP